MSKDEQKITHKDKEFEIVLENIVCTVDLKVDKQIPLRELSLELPNARYDPRKFPGLILYVRDVGTSVLLFRTGRIVVTGSKKMDDVYETIKKVCELLAKYGIHCGKDPEITVQNMVGHGRINYYVNLDLLDERDPEFSHYNPEQFPGLDYKLILPNGRRVNFLIFRPGELVITGAKSFEEMIEATKVLLDRLKKLGVLIPKEELPF